MANMYKRYPKAAENQIDRLIASQADKIVSQEGEPETLDETLERLTREGTADARKLNRELWRRHYVRQAHAQREAYERLLEDYRRQLQRLGFDPDLELPEVNAD